MKRWLTYSVLICLSLCWSGCDSPGAGCFSTEGDIIEEEFDVAAFDKVIVWKRVKLFVSQGPVHRVVVRTGENLIDEVNVRVEDGLLKVSDRNSCNLFRDYDVTEVFVTAPNLIEIRNSSGLTVENIGPIRWPFLALFAEDRLNEGEFQKDGDFYMTDLDVESLRVDANGVSTFYLEGRALEANFGLFDGDVRLDAGNLLVDRVVVRHRSTNKMIVHPLIAIRGWIRGIGDVIARNQPPVVDVEESFRGRLIFE